MDAQTQTAIRSDEISLKEILQLLLARKWWVISFTLLLTVSATVAAYVLPKEYRASVVISAVANAPENSKMGGLSSVVSEFSGLASLAGINVGTDTRKAESIAVLQSEALTESYIRDNDLLPILYAKRWDARAKRWRVAKPEQTPTLWKANQLFKRDIRTVTTDTKTGLVTLTITWKDAQQAAAWANGLVKLANDYLRQKTIDESERNIAYLKEQAAKTDVVGIRQAVYALMENEIDQEMLARGSEEYALKVLDPAFAPERPYSPQPMIWMLAGLFAGVLLSFIAAFVRIAWER
ncbi:MAG TPA: Wzz/FepE/Etk N-terminal domain-containing protein [Steroidobacteraceae bacterium]|nr:Wzz/FepE/Etk N-terminal domain-containing protein [Steroidobacteraceae bacterium]